MARTSRILSVLGPLPHTHRVIYLVSCASRGPKVQRSPSLCPGKVLIQVHKATIKCMLLGLAFSKRSSFVVLGIGPAPNNVIRCFHLAKELSPAGTPPRGRIKGGTELGT